MIIFYDEVSDWMVIYWYDEGKWMRCLWDGNEWEDNLESFCSTLKEIKRVWEFCEIIHEELP